MKKNILSKLLPGVFILLAVMGVALAVKKSGNQKNELKIIENPAGNTIRNTMMGNCRDGVYQAEASYLTPGGTESIQVSLTLKNNLVMSAEAVPSMINPDSQEYQVMFMNAYKQYVVGKNINEVKLDKISGSSLTPKGFNEAVKKILVQARV